MQVWNITIPIKWKFHGFVDSAYLHSASEGKVALQERAVSLNIQQVSHKVLPQQGVSTV